MPVIIFLCLIIPGIILCIRSAHHFRIKRLPMTLGIILILLAFSALVFTFTLEGKIGAREPIMTAEETIEYELVSLQADTEIAGNGTRFYLEVSEKTVFHFYYKTTKNGKEGFAPKTITSHNVFISETYETAPIILEINTTYDYPFTEFEKWWFQEYLHDLNPYTITSYEIYVPAGSIIESYNFN